MWREGVKIPKLHRYTINRLAVVFAKRIFNKFDNVIAVDANGCIDKRRVGKSTIIYRLFRKTSKVVKAYADIIIQNKALEMPEDEFQLFIRQLIGSSEKRKHDRQHISNIVNFYTPFRPKRDIVFGRKDALRHLAIKKFGYIDSDEAANTGYKRDFADREQIDTIKCLNMYADNYNSYAMVLGDFWDLDKDLRKLVFMRLTCVKRGFALIHIPRPTMYGSDPWDVNYNKKIENSWAESRTKKPNYSKLTTCVGYLAFNDLSPKHRAIYEAIKQEKRGRVTGFEEEHYVDDPEKKFYNNMVTMIRAGKINPETLEIACAAQGREPISVRKRLNKMLKTMGDHKTCKDYIMTQKKKQRRDLLGFNIETPTFG